MKIYIAAPLFSSAEKEQNKRITKILEDCGHEVFLPQRDGGCFAELPSIIAGISREKFLHKKDIQALNWCDAILFVFDGRVPDEGACFELGYAYAKGKRCFGFKTDTRSLIQGYDNLMIVVSVEVTLHSEKELESFFKLNSGC